MTYTTEQLLEVLDDEFSVHLKGERAFASARTHYENVSASIDSYWSIREQIHTYQAEHKVSGVVISMIDLPDGTVVRFPEQHHQLILVDGDIDVLRAAKERVVDAFLSQVTDGVYLSHTITSKDNGEWEMETTPEFIQYFAQTMEWAELAWLDECTFSLKLGYGEPVEGDYIKSQGADSWYFNAQKTCRNLGVKWA